MEILTQEEIDSLLTAIDGEDEAYEERSLPPQAMNYGMQIALERIKRCREERGTFLDLSDLGLAELPEELKSLKRLKMLDISRNKITALPEFLEELPELETLEYRGTPLEVFPKSLDRLAHSFKDNLVWHIGEVMRQTGKHGFGDYFLSLTRRHLDYISEKLHITAVQAALFCVIFSRHTNNSSSIADIAETFKCSKVHALQWFNDIKELGKKKLIKIDGRLSQNRFVVPDSIVASISENKEIIPVDYGKFTPEEFFAEIEKSFDQFFERDIKYDAFKEELKYLLTETKHLDCVKTMLRLDLCDEDLVLLLNLCQGYIFDDKIEIAEGEIERLYHAELCGTFIRRSLLSGSNKLFRHGLLENVNDDGFSDRNAWRLTEKAKKELVGGLKIVSKKNLMRSGKIPQKKLFYNKREGDAVASLASLLREENFKAVSERLAASGMRTGFACLFYGPPGTGKTETVYQIARETGRDIMAVNIAETKSCWYGESEKIVKKIFSDYRAAHALDGPALILLFNEADAIIGKRKSVEGANGTIAQTENTIQNIILQELENLAGILIATTNLTENMDSAFERRFLYKIEFSKPELSARKSIWQSIIPELSTEDAALLANRFDFSGGQIENIARKRTVESIIRGTPPGIEGLLLMCQEELLNRDGNSHIGFGV
jgi:hypothetical protein